MISYFFHLDTFLQFFGSFLCVLRWVRRLHDLRLHTFTYLVNRTFLFFLLPPVIVFCSWHGQPPPVCSIHDVPHWLIYHKMILFIILWFMLTDYMLLIMICTSHSITYAIVTPVERYNSTQCVPLNIKETIVFVAFIVTATPDAPESMNAPETVIDANAVDWIVSVCPTYPLFNPKLAAGWMNPVM